MVDRHPEFDAEQAYLDLAYAWLEEARARAHRATDGHGPQQGGTNQARHERESMLEGAVTRLSQLNLGDRSLVFGRIDPEGTGERFYIGRLGVWDRDQDPVVVDWRAPVAEPFYRATGRAPMGLERRRHFATRGRTLLGIDDELFGALAEGSGEELATRGTGALIAAPRRRARGVSATSSPRSRANRTRSSGPTCPGCSSCRAGRGPARRWWPCTVPRTCCTRIGSRSRGRAFSWWDRTGCSSPTSSRCCPRSARPASTSRCWPTCCGRRCGWIASTTKPPRVKGDARMVEVLARAVRDRERPLRADLVVGFGLQRLRVTVDESRRIVMEARRRSRGHNSGRKVVEELLFEVLAASARKHVDAATVRERIRHELPIREALDRMWPVLTPAHLLHDLYGSRALLRSANRGVFAEAEIQLLGRQRSAHADDVIWRFADVPLLDEACACWAPDPASATPTRCGPTDTSASTRRRISPRWSCAWWPGGR
ncbi:MAG: hypothetical protein R2695_07820 [Acidimicrobiales bacterium]